MGMVAGNGLHRGLFDDISRGHLRLRLLAMHWYGHLTTVQVLVGMSIGFYCIKKVLGMNMTNLTLYCSEMFIALKRVASAISTETGTKIRQVK